MSKFSYFTQSVGNNSYHYSSIIRRGLTERAKWDQTRILTSCEEVEETSTRTAIPNKTGYFTLVFVFIIYNEGPSSKFWTVFKILGILVKFYDVIAGHVYRSIQKR